MKPAYRLTEPSHKNRVKLWPTTVVILKRVKRNVCDYLSPTLSDSRSHVAAMIDPINLILLLKIIPIY